MREVTVAANAGFCFGVSRAVALAKEAGRGAWSLGQVIHNSAVTERLGLNVASSAEDIPDGARVIIRAHGATKEEIAALEGRGCDVIDATCPYVARIHRIVSKEDSEGRRVIVIGDHGHPEVRAIASRAKDAVVIGDEAELSEFIKNHPIEPEKGYSVVAQTTMDKIFFEKCKKSLLKVYTKTKIFDTICSATAVRRATAASLAAEVDAMVVIGDRLSANTARLAELCASVCGRTYLVSSADELPDLADCKRIGITAGASTPEWIIKEVKNKMAEENIVIEPIVEETITGEESFADMVEKSMKTLHRGQKVKGIVTRITNTDVQVDLGAKQTGFIPLSELSDDPSVKAADILKVGDEVEAFVTKISDFYGEISLSRKSIDASRNWSSAMEAQENKTVLTGTVRSENSGGVVVNVNGVEVFIPLSQTLIPKGQPATELVGKKVNFMIIDVDRDRRKVIGSIRAAARAERKAAEEKIWETLEVGQVYDGEVKNLMNYGAFVDIGGVEGMVHVTEVSWQHIRVPADVLKTGDKVKARVIALNPEKKKISLSLKDEAENPWTRFVNENAVGDIIDVKAVRFMPFGAFAEIIPGVDGLIHISQIADRRIANVADALTVGEIVKVKITAIDEEKKKVSLSIREAAEAAVEEEEVETEEENA